MNLSVRGDENISLYTGLYTKNSNCTDKYSAGDLLTHDVIPTMIDAAHAIAHNKIRIIDGEIVVTGSFNFTRAADYQGHWRNHLQ